MARPGEEPTEEPTPRRLAEARRRGEVAVSRELAGSIALLALVATLAGTAGSAWWALLGLIRALVARAFVTGDAGAAGWAAVRIGAGVLAAPLLATLVAGVLVSALQTGGLFAWGALKFDLERLSLAKGLKRVFGGAGLIEVGKGLLKLTVVGGVAVVVLMPLARQLPALTGTSARTVVFAFGALALRLAIPLGLALVVLGVLDWLLVRRKHRRSLMMTRDEVKREHKESEGDPHHRAERQRLHRELAEQRMLNDVRKASFVVVNPEHIAVAVRYDPDTQAAPQVIAKGERLLAQRIREVAREAGVPIYRDVTLAHALNEVPEGEEIPEGLYEAVAEVLRALWELERPGAVLVSTDGATAGEQAQVAPSAPGTPPAFWRRA